MKAREEMPEKNLALMGYQIKHCGSSTWNPSQYK